MWWGGGRWMAVWGRRPRRQERCVGLFPDHLETQVLLVGEGAVVVQYDGTVVGFAAAHAAASSAAAAAAAAADSCQTPWKSQSREGKAHFYCPKAPEKYSLLRKKETSD